MANVTVETIVAFSKLVLTQWYLKSRTSLLALDPADKIYTPKANITRVREVVATGAGDYNGVYRNVGGASTVVYKDYKANNDRYKQFVIDYLDEMASKPEGAKESILALAEDFINRCMASEIDAYAIASWVKAMPSSNVISNSVLKTDKDNIWNTLLDLQGNIFNSGVDNDIESIVYVSNPIYQNMQKYIIDKNGLANSALLSNRTALYDLGIDEIGDPIKINTKVIQFNNMTIVPMPKDRMNTEVLLYDGDSVGQTAGGWAPSEGSKPLDLVVIPKGCGFVDVRYQVLNYLVPMLSAEASNIKGAFDGGINKILGDVIIDNIGVNQKANAYELDFRTVYNAELFDIRKKSCFAVGAIE